ncbi:MAG: exosortase-associated EpsI family protein [Verrucomicrobia bacterium]|nr:exosortase-associated EpsI family protein [Verrucomicrobiota bacterium]
MALLSCNVPAALTACLFALAVGSLWAFPSFWYSKAAAQGEFVWLGEGKSMESFQFHEIPVSKSAESILVADRTVSGEFVSGPGSKTVRVFLAKRYVGDRNQESLLRHTPDACWAGAGWKMEAAEPPIMDCVVHGMTLRCERRLFEARGQREIVYFGALVGGRPVGFRLDHYLNAGRKLAQDRSGSLTRWLQETRYWGMAWDSFTNRTAFDGPQQFIRISTPVQGNDLAAADKLLQAFLPQWLHSVDYQKEYEEWQRAKREEQRARGKALSP